MEDMMFATVLYVGMICFACCLRYQPNCAATVEAATAKRLTDESQLGGKVTKVLPSAK